MATLYIFRKNTPDCEIATAIIMEMYKELIRVGKHVGFEETVLCGPSGYIDPVENVDDEYVFLDIDITDTIEGCTDVLDILNNGNSVIALYNHHDYKYINNLIHNNVKDIENISYEFAAGLKDSITSVAYKFANRRIYGKDGDTELNMFSCENTMNKYILGLSIYDIDPYTIFKKIIRKNDYNIFTPDEYTEKKLDGFYNARVKDGEIIYKYNNKIHEHTDMNASMNIMMIDHDKTAVNMRLINTTEYLQYDQLVSYYANNNYDIIITYYFDGLKYVYNMYDTEYVHKDKFLSGLSAVRRYDFTKPCARVLTDDNHVYCTFYMNQNPFQRGCSVYLTEKKFGQKNSYYIKIS